MYLIKNILPLFFTLFNIFLTIVFTITIVPHIKDLDAVGLVRLQTRNIDRCVFQIHPAFINDTVLNALFESDIVDCIVTNQKEINNTLTHLKFMNNFPQNMLMKHVNKERKLLNDVIIGYYNTLNTIPFPEFFNNTHASDLLKKSEKVIIHATLLNDSHANTIANVMIAISIMMSITVVCQIFYNVNTIILKKQQKKQLEITIQYNSLNQVCHEIRNSLLPIDMCMKEIVKINKDNNNNKYLQTMMYDMNYVKYILKRRLDYNKILKKEYITSLSCINLYEFIKSYIPTFNMYAKEVNKIIIIFLSNLEHKHINIDTYLFHHLLTNIIRNAIKYGRDDVINEIFISSSIERNIINLEIEDNGIGTVETHMNKTKFGNNSYGLGIPFVKNIMKLIPHGNIQWIDKNTINNELYGTIVKISFELNECIDIPLDSSKSYDNSFYDESVYDGSVYDESVYTENENENSTDWKDKLRLSIIDDCIIARKCVKHAITKIHNINWKSIHSYENTEQFLEKKTTFYKTDVILVDQNMESSGGVMKGTEFILKMFHTYEFPGLIIVITGNKEDAENILEKQFKLTNKKITVWEKPLPGKDIIMNVLTEFYENNKN